MRLTWEKDFFAQHLYVLAIKRKRIKELCSSQAFVLIKSPNCYSHKFYERVLSEKAAQNFPLFCEAAAEAFVLFFQ